MQNLHPILDFIKSVIYTKINIDIHTVFILFFVFSIEVIFHIYQMIYRYYSSFILLYIIKKPKNIVLLV